MSAPSETAPVEFEARAFLLGERIDLRGIGLPDRLAVDPLTVRHAGGIAVVFRYGAVVLFDVRPEHAEALFSRLSDRVSSRLAERETEAVTIRIDPEAREGMEDNTIVLHERSPERFQLVADVLSKSVVLAFHETRVAESFRNVEPVAVELSRKGSASHRARELLRLIGGALVSELKIVGRVEVADKPELTWERPDLERLYVRLAEEFEIRERYRVLDRKLGLISRTAETVLELLQHRHVLRVEWYIVILIIVEIVLMLCESFLRGV